MKRTISLLLSFLLILSLSACSLARPERETEQTDRFCGVYMAWSADGSFDFYNNPAITEYGAEEVDLGAYGKHSFPKEVLFAGADGKFPGLPGYALYEVRVGNSSRLENNMCAGNYAVKFTDSGGETELSATLYVDSERAKGIWKSFNVWQTADGRVYLDGSGDSTDGCFTFTRKVETKRTSDGETETDSVSVTVEIAERPQIKTIYVNQYSAGGQLLSREPVEPADEIPDARWLDGAAWLMVEEVSQNGVSRAAYDRPYADGDPATHTLVILGADGVGREVYLKFI